MSEPDGDDHRYWDRVAERIEQTAIDSDEAATGIGQPVADWAADQWEGFERSTTQK